MGVLRRDRAGPVRHVVRWVLRKVGDVVERDLARATPPTVALARRHRDTVMCGRTHGQPGLPMTFGFKAAVWASELARHQERLAQLRPRVEVVQLGGALGTMEFWGERRTAVAGRVRRAAGAGCAGHPVDHRTGRHRRVHDVPRARHRHARQDRQRGLRAAAARDRRGRGADRRGHGRQHHDAAQAQPGVLRAARHARPRRARRRRRRAGGARRAARARRAQLEGRVARAARGVPAHRRGAGVRRAGCWKGCGWTPHGCAPTSTRTAPR